MASSFIGYYQMPFVHVNMRICGIFSMPFFRLIYSRRIMEGFNLNLQLFTLQSNTQKGVIMYGEWSIEV